MSDVDTHIEYFNLTTGLVFDYLFRNFPISQEIGPWVLGAPFASITEEAEDHSEPDDARVRVKGKSYIRDSNIPPDMYIDETLKWLEAESYLRATPDNRWQLTTQTLALLGKQPSGLGSAYSSRLGNAVKNAGAEGGRAAISEIVGQIIGAAAKGMVGA